MLVFSIEKYIKDMTEVYKGSDFSHITELRRKEDGEKVIVRKGIPIIEKTGEHVYLSWCKRTGKRG